MGSRKSGGNPLDPDDLATSRPSFFTVNQDATIDGAELPEAGVWYDDKPSGVDYTLQSRSGAIALRGVENRVAETDLLLQVFNTSTNPIDLGTGLDVLSLEARSDGKFEVSPGPGLEVDATAGRNDSAGGGLCQPEALQR